MVNIDRLTAKQKRFAEEFVNNGYNAAQAYLAAYDCNYDTAKNQGYLVARKPHVREYINRLQKEQFEVACISAERVALKLADIAFASGDDEYYNATAQLKALDLLQKQLGLQHQNIKADVNQDIIINIEG